MIGEDYAYAGFSVIHQGALLIAGLIGTALVNPIFIPIVLGLSILGAMLPKFAERPVQRVQTRIATAKSDYVSKVGKVTGGLDKILSIRRIRRLSNLMGRSIEDVEQAENSRNALRNFVWTLTWIFGMVIIIGVWGIGSMMAQRGLITIGAIVALAQLMTQVAGPLQSLAEQYPQIIAGRQQLQALQDLLSSNRSEEASISEVDACSDGARVLITGPSGAGKSSLLRGMAGLEHADGSMTVGPNKIDSIASRVGIVRLITQQTFLIPGTVGENLDPDLTGAPVADLAVQNTDLLGGFLDDILRNPNMPAENLSGGEARRIHDATGLGVSGDVLLLDEVTTGLDNQGAMDVLSTALASPASFVFAVAHDLPATPQELGFTHRLHIRDGSVTGFEVLTESERR